MHPEAGLVTREGRRPGCAAVVTADVERRGAEAWG
jgi:hypothetical protein